MITTIQLIRLVAYSGFIKNFGTIKYLANEYYNIFI